jgi:hypothetical protein
MNNKLILVGIVLVATMIIIKNLVFVEHYRSKRPFDSLAIEGALTSLNRISHDWDTYPWSTRRWNNQSNRNYYPYY